MSVKGKGRVSKKERLLVLRRKGTILGIVALAFNVVIVIGLLYVLLVTGNIFMMIPLVVFSAIVNQISLSKLNDYVAEVYSIRTNKPKPENAMMEGLKEDLREAKEMVTDRYFWRLVVNDIKDAFRELKARGK